jgi:bis(5'-nucleosidyl)-tetraphosphatase
LFKNMRGRGLFMPQESSVGAVIYRKEGGRTLYLLLHYEAGHWDFAKGNVEKDEAERETATREAEEETGIGDLEFLEGFREKIEYFYKRDGKAIHKQVVFLLAQTKTREVKISWEHIGFEWLAYEAALGRLTYKNAKETLGKADSFLAGKQ